MEQEKKRAPDGETPAEPTPTEEPKPEPKPEGDLDS
jgi:hypothetical protein